MFQVKYQKIRDTARTASEQWDKSAVPRFQEEIRNATGSKKVALRSELVDTVAQSVLLQAEDYTREVTSMLTQEKTEVQQLVTQGQEAAYNIGRHLTSLEIEELLADFQMSDFWDDRAEAESVGAAQDYQTHMQRFSDALLKVAANIEQADSEGAAGFTSMLGDVQKGWGK